MVTPPSRHECANCFIKFSWPSTVEGGKEYCCAGCAQGGPCVCRFDQPAVMAPPGKARRLILWPREAVQSLSRTYAMMAGSLLALGGHVTRHRQAYATAGAVLLALGITAGLLIQMFLPRDEAPSEVVTVVTPTPVVTPTAPEVVSVVTPTPAVTPTVPQVVLPTPTPAGPTPTPEPRFVSIVRALNAPVEVRSGTAVSQQGEGDGLADATSRPRDDGDLARRSH